MAWTQPKTDWTESDYFNAYDYNRIVDNVLYIQELSLKTVGKMNFKAMKKDKRVLDMIYAREFNAIEENVEQLSRYYKIDDTTVRFVDNGAFVTYTELNRLESLTKRLYETINSQIELLTTLPFKLGTKKLGKKADGTVLSDVVNNIDSVTYTGDKWNPIPFIQGANNVLEEDLWYICADYEPPNNVRRCTKSGIVSDFNDYDYLFNAFYVDWD